MGRAQLLRDEGAPRLAVAIRDRHTARIVDEHAEKILLRDRGLQDQRRAEQAHEQDGERREAQADEHSAIASAVDGRQSAIRDERQDRSRHGRRGRDDDRPREAPTDVALLKHQRRVLEQEAENGLDHQGAILLVPGRAFSR